MTFKNWMESSPIYQVEVQTISEHKHSRSYLFEIKSPIVKAIAFPSSYLLFLTSHLRFFSPASLSAHVLTFQTSYATANVNIMFLPPQQTEFASACC